MTGLDPVTRIACRGGKHKTLPPREASVLALLLRHPGETLSAQRMLQEVWGRAAKPVCNVVAKSIERVRAKVDTDAATRLIQNVADG